MDTLIALLGQWGLWMVFLAVLLDQGGIPLPAYPILVVAGAIAAQGGSSLWPIVLAGVAAALLADALWYAAGRRLGSAMLRLICRVSLSPDTCVSTTRGLYARWGAPSLLVAKFIPGVAAVATTLAGQTRTSPLKFAFYDGLGAALWVGSAVALGAIFHEAMYDIVSRIKAAGRIGLLVLAAALTAFVCYKFWKRRRFLRLIRMARISPAELHRLMDQGTRPVVLDARAADERQHLGWIPGAIPAPEVHDLDPAREREVVIYCDCPNEASAALLARQLMNRGFRHVRPLAGGFDAWSAEGLPIARAAPD